jgi:hypothetical protein
MLGAKEMERTVTIATRDLLSTVLKNQKLGFGNGWKKLLQIIWRPEITSSLTCNTYF